MAHPYGDIHTKEAINGSNRYAPWYDIPSSLDIASIEHPCIIENIDKGAQTIGSVLSLVKVCLLSRKMGYVMD